MVASPPHLPPLIQTAAGMIAGQPVTVSCIGSLGADGITVSNIIMLDNTVCRGLLELLHGGRDGTAANAVLTVTHEAEHAAGIADETDAECKAVKDVPWMMRLLHLRLTPDFRSTIDLAHGLTRGDPMYAKHPC